MLSLDVSLFGIAKTNINFLPAGHLTATLTFHSSNL
jgi:hypothetical protein